MHYDEERSEEEKGDLTKPTEPQKQKAPALSRSPLIMLGASLVGLAACSAFVIFLIVLPFPVLSQGIDATSQASQDASTMEAQGGQHITISSQTPVTQGSTATSVSQASPRYSFDSGSIAGWESVNAALSATTEQHWAGSSSLQASFNNQDPTENPYVYLTGNALSSLSAGKTLSAYFYVPQSVSATITASWTIASSGNWHDSQEITLPSGQWVPLSYTLPDMITKVSEIGLNFHFVPLSASNVSLCIDLISW